MSKLILSDKKYMDWFLSRFLGESIYDYEIINKFDGCRIDTDRVIELLKQELINSNVHVRTKTVDLLVRRDNMIIDIEINSRFDINVRKRNFAYLSNVYSNLLNHGKKYRNQPKCVQINICKGISYDYDNYCLLGENYNKKFISNFNFLFLILQSIRNYYILITRS